MSEDWLGIPGLKADLPVDELMDALAFDALRPLPYSDPGIDPVQYEVAVHRIQASLREGAWALVRTSSSPLVTECGEYMFAIYDAEGHAAYVTAGVLPHLTGTEAGIKYIRHCYGSDEESIHPCDQFLLNDPYLLGIHTPDILVARPVFHGGEIVAWIGCLTHTIEIGAKDPGGTADSTDIYQEGIRIPCLKLVSRGQTVPHVLRMIERAVRHPALVSLDISAKVAGNNVTARRIEEMVELEGSGFLKGVLAKLIHETETKARQRIKSIPDGHWRNTVHADHDGQVPALTRLELSMEKRGEVIHIDFEGTSPQCPGPVNATLPGTIGSIFTVLVSTIFCDLPANRGIVSSCRISIPKGCMFNPRYPAPCYAAPPGPLTLLSSAVTKLVSEMAMAGGLSEFVTAPWNGSVNSVFMGGLDQYDQLQGTLTLDSNGGGTGASPMMDGDDTSAYMLAPGSFMADVEMYEANYPLLYLFRRQRRDSAGHGEMRGGLGGEAAVAVHGSDGWRVGFRGLGTQVAVTHGMAGAYPASPARVGYVWGANPQGGNADNFAKFQGSLDEISGLGRAEAAEALTPPKPMKEGDVYYLAWSGGGGLGDPQQREPESVALDVAAGTLSRQCAAEIYGVVLAPDGAPEPAPTEELRAQIRAARLANCTSPAGPLAQAEEILDQHYGILHTALAGGEPVLACVKCKTLAGTPDEDFHAHLASREVEPATVGHESVRADWVTYREYFCRQCATLVDVTQETK